MALPNFLFVGADKTGSTWIYELLRSHPACFVPSVKDIRFFDDEYRRGLGWYESFFSSALPAHTAVGELSHNYLFSEQAPQRIKLHLAQARILMSLRHPVDRAFSHYLFMIRSGRTKRSFEEVLDDYPEIVAHSTYAPHVQRYCADFDTVRIFFYDDLLQSASQFGRDIQDFLGLEPLAGYDYDRRVQGASLPRNYYAAALIRQGANTVRRFVSPRIVGLLQREQVRRLVYRELDRGDRPRLDPAARERLCELFSEDVSQVEAITGRDLSAWRS